MSLKVGDLVEFEDDALRLLGAGGVAVNKNVIVTSLNTFIGWVEVFDGQKTVTVPRYSLRPVGE
jgi:hypothetical protein